MRGIKLFFDIVDISFVEQVFKRRFVRQRDAEDLQDLVG